MKNDEIPQFVSKTVWFIDKKDLDLKENSSTIIKQVLFFGDVEALSWILAVYGKTIIATVAQGIPLGDWNKRSLALWKLCLGISPKTREEQMKERSVK